MMSNKNAYLCRYPWPTSSSDLLETKEGKTKERETHIPRKYFSTFVFKDGSTLMHIASQAGHPETTLVFLKKGVPLHMPNKVNRAYPLLKVETQ